MRKFAIAAIKEIFGAQGKLAQYIAGYVPRKVQIQMALAVKKAFKAKQVLMVEAGTGTGKTYAYLVPSLLSGKKVIISTGTKNLQDQLFYRDIPILRNALGIHFNVAMLKGRSNYLCLQRLDTYCETTEFDQKLQQALYAVKRWAQTTTDGEIENIMSLTSQLTILPYITSTRDNCLGQECQFFNQCFITKARKRAQTADLIIINHHLFFANHSLQNTNTMDLLPESDAIIFDEAHQLPEVAVQFLGDTVSFRHLSYLVRDILAELHCDASDMLALKNSCEQVDEANKLLLQAFGTMTRGLWQYVVHKPQLKLAVAQLLATLIQLHTGLAVIATRSHSLENCWHRTVDLTQRFKKLATEFPKDQVHWYEVQENYFAFHHTPLYSGDDLSKLIIPNKTWIFTSATLTVSGNFSHFQHQLGITATTQLCLNSPFNYAKQALLYLPKLVTDPNDSHYLIQMLKAVIPVLQLTKGKAFLLFTSHKALKEAAQFLEQKLSFPLFVQGTAAKTQLLSLFCTTPHAILLGTSSFWEGVDVKGNTLSCVIIDKIPFASPDDPILKARLDYYRHQGKNPFLEYQLPAAVIMLRQGAGRLIRDINDKGILMLCDPRITTKDYGSTLLKSLPPIPITNDLLKVQHFLAGN